MTTHPDKILVLSGLLSLMSGCGYFKSDEEVMDPDGDGAWYRDDDCDDERGDVYPGADEIWYDGIDNDCDPTSSDVDADADGHAAEVVGGDDCADDNSAVFPGASDGVDESDVDENCDGIDGIDEDQDSFASASSGGADCNDQDADVNPEALEVCDEADNDCDGQTDEADADDAAIWYQDLDEDGYGDETATIYACSQPDGFVPTPGDCDDSDGNARPDGVEEPYNESDDDCNPTTPDDDLDADGYGAEVIGGPDCDDGNAAVSPDATEVCDEVDNDCDGVADEDDAFDAPTWYADNDGDGFGDESRSMTACSAPEGYVDSAGDCDDGDAGSLPGGFEEPYNGADDDCDTTTADDDLDGDGFGAQVLGGEDCNDGDINISPDSTETCDEVDNDCDGETDESDASDALTWYADSDGDGYGDSSSAAVSCTEPSDYVAIAGDCDDNDDGSWPGGIEEPYNGADDDCSSTTPDDDLDGDGFGAEALGGEDCDDGDSAISPDDEEACDEIDNDCDGVVDEDDAADAGTWYGDADGDGFGGDATTATSCTQPSGYLADATDCNDNDAAVYPGGEEVCSDGVVNDCDGDEPTARAACGLYGTLSLSTATAKFTGEAEYDYSGQSVSAAGDVDGDGLNDLLVGAPRADSAGWDADSESGATYLLLGGGVLEGTSGTLGLSDADLTLAGESVDAHAGFSVSGGRDIDGDGLEDVLIGAIWEDAGGPYAGAAYLLLGGSALAGSSGTMGLSNSDLKLTGESSDEVGTSVSMLADVDGDDLDDLLVGAYGEDTGGTYCGAAYLFLSRGALAGIPGNIGVSDADLQLTGEAAGDRSGWSVSGVGDVDGDGLEDLLVGANFEDTGGTEAGAVYLLLGGAALDGASGTTSLSGSDLKLTGEAAGDYLGGSVSGAGDVDGDGLSDLLAGADGEDTGGKVAGAAYLLLGGGALEGASGTYSLSIADLKITGEDLGDRAGQSVDGVGDTDGDELDDVLIGAYNEAAGGTSRGAAYILLGGGALEGASGTLDLSNADAKLTGEAGGDYTGYAVSGAEDVDGDGFADFMVGAIGETSGGTWAGATYLILGGGY